MRGDTPGVGADGFGSGSGAGPRSGAGTGSRNGSGALTTPRIVLVTGAGGAGRTTVAAATALACARDGARALLLSTEEDGVLEGVLDTPVPVGGPGAPVEVEPGGGLWAARPDPDAELGALAALLRQRGRPLLEFTGAEALDDDELTPLPGAEEFALLRALHTAAGQSWDTVVVDLPPAARALRTLALPGQLHRYLDRLLPPRKQAARALRPLLAELAGVPMPGPDLYAAAGRFHRRLAEAEAVPASGRTAVRLVVEPGPQAVEPLCTARAAVALYGLRAEAVIANRVLPTDSRDAWLAGLSGEQQTALKALRDHQGLRGVPVRELPHLGRAPRGPAALAELAALAEPAAVGEPAAEGPAAPGDAGGVAGAGAVEDRLAAEGRLYWRLPLPGARKETLGLLRRGGELVVSVGPHRRTLPLPSALRRCRVVGASFEDGELCVRFEPEPELWPRRGPGAPAGG